MEKVSAYLFPTVRPMPSIGRYKKQPIRRSYSKESGRFRYSLYKRTMLNVVEKIEKRPYMIYGILMQRTEDSAFSFWKESWCLVSIKGHPYNIFINFIYNRHKVTCSWHHGTIRINPFNEPIFDDLVFQLNKIFLKVTLHRRFLAHKITLPLISFESELVNIWSNSESSRKSTFWPFRMQHWCKTGTFKDL